MAEVEMVQLGVREVVGRITNVDVLRNMYGLRMWDAIGRPVMEHWCGGGNVR